MNQERVAIIGIGDLPVGKYPEYGEMELAALAISKALKDSGLKKDQIEGYFAGPDNLIASGYHHYCVCWWSARYHYFFNQERDNRHFQT